MDALQYEITLPADYDMRIVRTRVADVGHLLDDRAGLGLKAYLIRERGRDGSPVNQYAPFYLWNSPGALAHFLVGGGGFQGIVRDFGRPAARRWVGLACGAGPARGAVPTAASRRLSRLPVHPSDPGDPSDPDASGTAPADRVSREVEELAALARRPGVHTAALALDTACWELVRFVLWCGPAPQEDGAERYEVLHLSAPEQADLPEGRCW